MQALTETQTPEPQTQIGTDTQKLGEQLLQEAQRIALEEKARKLGISVENLDIITRRGYEPLEVLNRNSTGLAQEGSTRRVYKAIYRNGNLEREVVLKIPEPDSLVHSVNARMNRAKRNIDLQEALIGGKISHPYIVRTVDSFQLGDGSTANAEDFIEGRSVRKDIRRNGLRRSREMVKEFFTPVLEAFEYLHSNGILHRDVGTENMMVPSRRNGIIITDLQNAAMKIDIEPEAVPTKGTTSGTSPELLNAIATGRPAEYGERNEVYSLGAVLYEVVTGEKLFDYTLNEQEDGKPVVVNGKEFRIKLKKDGKDLESISLEDQEAELKTRLQRAPRYLRSFLYDMLSTKSKKQIKTVYEAQARFKRATRTTREEIIDTVKKYAAAAGSILVLGFTTSWGIATSAFTSGSSDRVPTLSDVLRFQTRIDLNANHGVRGFGDNLLAAYGSNDLEKYYDQALKNKDKLESEELNILSRHFLRTTPGLDTRLIMSMIRSMTLVKDKIDFKDERGDYFVPKEFIMASCEDEREGKRVMEDIKREGLTKWIYTARYIQGNYRFGDSLEDVYTRVLCSPGEIRKAIAKAQESTTQDRLRNQHLLGNSPHIQVADVIASLKSQDYTYFPRGVIENNGTTIKYVKGYGDFLPQDKKEVIDRAIAFYLATDDAGKTHFDRYNSLEVKPKKSNQE